MIVLVHGEAEDELTTLPDKVVHGNRGLSNIPSSSYVKSFNKELHIRPYMVTKRRYVWNKTFPLGHFMLYFTTFIMFLSP